jgi:hypothetical protein
MSPKQKHALHVARHKAGVKAAVTFKKEVAAFKKKHGGAEPKKGQIHPPRKLCSAAIDDEWILGGNDRADSCVAAAIANSLLAVTGIRANEDEVLALHETVGPVGILDTLLSLMRCGLAGVQPVGFVAWPYIGQGSILGVSLPEPHAVTYDNGELITWGGKIPFDPRMVEEAWLVCWPATDEQQEKS